jgi:hypothetical protein
MKKKIYLSRDQVKDLIKKAEKEGEVIVVRCVRKTPASKPGGPDIGQLYDLHCSSPPSFYKPINTKRKREDKKLGLLTVFATNRQDSKTGTWGAWRRLNMRQIQKVIYRTNEYEINHN